MPSSPTAIDTTEAAKQGVCRVAGAQQLMFSFLD